MTNRESTTSHGRHAHKPTHIPRHGWFEVLKRVKEDIGRDHVSLVAAGVAFYSLLALFPAIVAVISIWGLLFDPQQISQQISSVSHLLPQQAAGIIRQQAQQASASNSTGMGLAAIGGILLAVYSASRGIKGLMDGLNIVYEEQEKRGFIKKTAIILGLTLGAVVMAVVTLGAITAIPTLVKLLGLGGIIGTLINLLRWPLLLVMVMVALAILFRYAPDRRKPRWQWASAGSVVAVPLWLIGSIGFSIYVRNFASYNETYGSLGAVVVLLMWFWLSAFIVLMGAALNSELERQTRHDTTAGDDQPVGERGADAADSVARDDR
ncbi:YihY/virulence factor BrkB family protein [Halomonas sp. HP20-15]|uniref:YihY/virulence factor BrkB family protein n=1 Tax=Halomonas sp. HP20-15 TaxID=3085901 RepID=UPI002981521A|nr:YihY/virulence factor BrkB family protein [Halomonas sp. HP20-15]MDW5378104.1 YihY/virulence factor BrkB family protein [Halomonas sp. HP20-15]